jgi:hypothetical protein
LAGVISAGAALFVVGPSIIFPVFVAGAIAGAAAIDHRPAEPEEREFADQVFGSSLPWGRIRLTNLVGLGGAAFVCPNTDDQILVNLGAAFGSPRTFTNENNPVPGQLFIHELTHAWQIHHGRLDATFLWDGIIDKITGPDYAYGPAGPPFSDFGIEEKAALVEEWFAGRTRWASFAWPGQRQAMDMNDPYFRYISENIRLGRT